MAAFLGGLLADMLTALRTDLGAYDLSTVSGTHRVMLAEDGFPVTLAPPFVAIGSPEPVRVDYSDGAPLTQYRVAAEIPIFCFAPATADTPSSRMLAALDLASEVVTALQDMHANPAYIYGFDLVVLTAEVQAVYGGQQDQPGGPGVAELLIRVETRRERGI